MLRNKPVIGTLWAAVACALLLGAPRALAADAAEVEALIKKGLDLRRQQKDALAYPLFQKAHALGSTPRTAAQLGLVEFNLGYWLEAERHLSEALAAQRDVWVNQHRAVLEESLEKTKKAIGEVLVVGTPSGAEIEVNGKAVGTLPMAAPVRLGEGPARVEVRAPGYAPATRSLNVAGGQREEVSLALAPLAPAAPPPATTPAPATGDAPGAAGAAPWMRPLAWTSAVLAAGAFAFAAVQTSTWFDKIDEFDNHLPGMPAMQPAMPDCGENDPNRGGPGCREIYDDLTRARTRAIIGYTAGALLAAGSVTLFVLSSRTTGEPQVACAPSLAFNGAGCRFRF